MAMRNGHREREVVVITGASAGVGRATARRFAARGARIGLLARGLDGLNAARIEVEALGGEALILPADVADADEVREAARLVAHTWGRIDVWINNAMVAVFSPVKEMTAGDYARVTQVTYLGAVNGTLAALAHMTPRDRGVIIQVSSALADRGVPLQSAHFAAKRALAAFSQSLRRELLNDGSHVRVSVVDLPTMNTPQFDWAKNRLRRQQQPIPPIYQPEVAARAIAHAVRYDRRRLRLGRGSRPRWPSDGRRGSWIATWRGRPTRPSSWRSPRIPGVPRTSGRRCAETTARTVASTSWPGRAACASGRR